MRNTGPEKRRSIGLREDGFVSVSVLVPIVAAFLLSLIAIVLLELGAGWTLDTEERSFIVLLSLLIVGAVMWARLKGEKRR